MFNGRWRIYGIKDLDNCDVAKLTGREIKQKCFEFFKAGFLLSESSVCCVGNTAITDEEVIKDASFEQWWSLYDKKRGREKCKKKWLKLTSRERADCIAATPAYVASTSDKQFRKDPYTYLNNKSWLDEIIIRDTTPTPQQLQQQRISEAARLASKYATEGNGNQK